MMAYVLTLMAVGGIAAGQILFKITATGLSGRPMTEALRDPAVMAPFGAALVVYGFATIFWVLALRELPLGRAYMFMAASFVIVPMVSVVLFAEKLGPGYFAGLALILVGLVVTQTFR